MLGGLSMIGNIGSLGLYPGIQFSNSTYNKTKKKHKDKYDHHKHNHHNNKIIKETNLNNKNLMVLKNNLVKKELKGVSTRLYLN